MVREERMINNTKYICTQTIIDENDIDYSIEHPSFFSFAFEIKNYYKIDLLCKTILN
jgi:hypothetical protein